LAAGTGSAIDRAHEGSAAEAWKIDDWRPPRSYIERMLGLIRWIEYFDRQF